MRDSARITTEVFKTLSGGAAGGMGLSIVQNGITPSNILGLFILFFVMVFGFILIEVSTGYKPD